MKKMTFGFLILFLASMALLECATVPTAPAVIPFPDNLAISPPDPSLPDKIRAFSGVWEGTWDGLLASRLAVEKIDRNTATVVYGWAESPQGGFKGGWVRLRAEVKDKGAIEWGDANKTQRFTFTMGENLTSIKGEREERAVISLVEMRKKQ